MRRQSREENRRRRKERARGEEAIVERNQWCRLLGEAWMIEILGRQNTKRQDTP